MNIALVFIAGLVALLLIDLIRYSNRIGSFALAFYYWIVSIIFVILFYFAFKYQC